MLSALFIFNYKGEVLISRFFRTDVRRNSADQFRIHVITAPTVRSPVTMVDGSLTFFHIKHENVYVVAAARANVNAAMAFEVCNKVVHLAQAYFGKLNEESVKAHFTLIYELLDEFIDFGFPQLSDVDTLKQFITTDTPLRTALMDATGGLIPSAATGASAGGTPAAAIASQITIQATGATSWRRPDIKYRRNEVFIDVVEKVNLLMSAKGTVLSQDVQGTIKVKAYLSGTPECKFGLNERGAIDKEGTVTSPGGSASASGGGSGNVKKLVEIDDFQFHQCVKLGRFDADRCISFVPPDGEFDLMRYRAADGISLPFKLMPVVTSISATRLEYKINLKAQFARKFTATGIVVKIPTPPNTVAVNGLGNFANGHGRAKYVAAENCIVWKISRIPGGYELDLNAEAELAMTMEKKPWTRPPISIDFTVAMLAASGVQVRYLKIYEKSGYDTIKWVRYHSSAGSYQVRF